MPEACLNCGAPIENAYCPHCGQKTTTHRFSLRNMFQEDFIKGVLEIDKGLLFTIRQLMVRPGHAIREYVSGKRINFYNYLTLLLLIIAVDVMILEFSQVKFSDVYTSEVKNSGFKDAIDTIMKEYQKVVVLCSIPVYALFSFLLFKKAKQNYAEHLVLNTYRAAGELTLSMSISIVLVLTNNIPVIRIVSSVISVVIFVYSALVYYQYFQPYGYRRTGLILRSILTGLSLAFASTLLALIYTLLVMSQGKA